MKIKSTGLFAFPAKKYKTIDAINALALKVEKQHSQKKSELFTIYVNSTYK